MKRSLFILFSFAFAMVASAGYSNTSVIEKPTSCKVSASVEVKTIIKFVSLDILAEEPVIMGDLPKPKMPVINPHVFAVSKSHEGVSRGPPAGLAKSWINSYKMI